MANISKKQKEYLKFIDNQGCADDLVGSGIENPGLETLAGGKRREVQGSCLEDVAGNNFDTSITQED